MEPQQQPGQLGHNPYDFILNPPKPTHRHPLGGLPLPRIGGRSLFMQIIVLVGGAAIVMVIIAVAISALTGNKLNTTDLINLAAEQTELISVSTAGGGMVSQASNQQLAINTRLTLETDNRVLLSFLASDRTKVSTKQLGVDANAEIPVELQNAQQSSTVDTVFAQIMQSQLQSYASNIKKDYAEATNSTLRQLLSVDYTQAELLLKQVPSSSSVQN
jgi:hypothetical protein